MTLRDEAFNSINTYFTTLSAVGYKSYEDVYKILTLIFIEELLYEFPIGIVSEEDYKYWNKVLERFYGTSCLIPYPTYKKGVTAPLFKISDLIRYSEDDIIRLSERFNVRIVS